MCIFIGEDGYLRSLIFDRRRSRDGGTHSRRAGQFGPAHGPGVLRGRYTRSEPRRWRPAVRRPIGGIHSHTLNLLRAARAGAALSRRAGWCRPGPTALGRDRPRRPLRGRCSIAGIGERSCEAPLPLSFSRWAAGDSSPMRPAGLIAERAYAARGRLFSDGPAWGSARVCAAAREKIGCASTYHTSQSGLVVFGQT